MSSTHAKLPTAGLAWAAKTRELARIEAGIAAAEMANDQAEMARLGAEADALRTRIIPRLQIEAAAEADAAATREGRALAERRRAERPDQLARIDSAIADASRAIETAVRKIGAAIDLKNEADRLAFDDRVVDLRFNLGLPPLTRAPDLADLVRDVRSLDLDARIARLPSLPAPLYQVCDAPETRRRKALEALGPWLPRCIGMLSPEARHLIEYAGVPTFAPVETPERREESADRATREQRFQDESRQLVQSHEAAQGVVDRAAEEQWKKAEPERAAARRAAARRQAETSKLIAAEARVQKEAPRPRRGRKLAQGDGSLDR